MQRKRHCGFGIQESYAEYGMATERAKALIKECREARRAGEGSGKACKTRPCGLAYAVYR